MSSSLSLLPLTTCILVPSASRGCVCTALSRSFIRPAQQSGPCKNDRKFLKALCVISITTCLTFCVNEVLSVLADKQCFFSLAESRSSPSKTLELLLAPLYSSMSVSERSHPMNPVHSPAGDHDSLMRWLKCGGQISHSFG